MTTYIYKYSYFYTAKGYHPYKKSTRRGKKKRQYATTSSACIDSLTPASPQIGHSPNFTAHYAGNPPSNHGASPLAAGFVPPSAAHVSHGVSPPAAGFIPSSATHTSHSISLQAAGFVPPSAAHASHGASPPAAGFVPPSTTHASHGASQASHVK